MEPENFRIRTANADDDAKYNFPSDLPLRPGVNSTGKAIQIRVNQYKVTQWPGRDIFQYDVSFLASPLSSINSSSQFRRSTSEMALRRRARSWLSGSLMPFRIALRNSARVNQFSGMETSSSGIFEFPIDLQTLD